MKDRLRVVNTKIIESWFTIFAFIFFMLFFGLLIAWPIKWLWNYLMPYLFDLKQISWWQAWCINMFCAILFKGTSVKG